MEDYYLANRKLSWWALSLADLSSYIDIAGTMINTALIYALGAQPRHCIHLYTIHQAFMSHATIHYFN